MNGGGHNGGRRKRSDRAVAVAQPETLTRPNRRYKPIDGSVSLDLRWVIVNSLQSVLNSKIYAVDYMCMYMEIRLFEFMYIYIDAIYCSEWEQIVNGRTERSRWARLIVKSESIGGGTIKKKEIGDMNLEMFEPLEMN